MSLISVSNLTFSYDGNENIFENVSFNIDSSWKLGFVGRNGKGKTTFLNLLLGKYEYYGSINSKIDFEYFPYEVDSNLTSYEIAESRIPNFETWRLDSEVSKLDIDLSILNRKFKSLSKGEQTKVLLAILFINDNKFLLIDEPTNHLDINGRNIVAKYLNSKKGFILVSHDRAFLDKCVDHILSINRNNITIEQGNFSSFWINKQRQDEYELSENEKLKSEIKRLDESSRQSSNWSNKVEASKYRPRDDIFVDKGYIGHKAAKMMKRSKVLEKHREQKIEEKSKLLKNIELSLDLKMNYKQINRKTLVEANNISIYYDDKCIFKDKSFRIEQGDRLEIKGSNGCGKSSLIKLLLNKDIKYNGDLYIVPDLKISYISQDTSYLNGLLKDFISLNNLDETLFKTILRKLNFKIDDFDKRLESLSEGEKKKILIAKSLCEEANLYIWDEPLNYIDVWTRIQIEKVINEYNPTMIFVEHDLEFSKNIRTKLLEL